MRGKRETDSQTEREAKKKTGRGRGWRKGDEAAVAAVGELMSARNGGM
jgi:hypothetical protein